MKNNSDGSEFRYKKAVYSLVIFIAGLFGGLWYSSLNTSKTSIINPFKPSESSETREGGGNIQTLFWNARRQSFQNLCRLKIRSRLKFLNLKQKKE